VKKDAKREESEIVWRRGEERRGAREEKSEEEKERRSGFEGGAEQVR
jgi:hypothetical protein